MKEETHKLYTIRLKVETYQQWQKLAEKENLSLADLLRKRMKQETQEQHLNTEQILNELLELKTMLEPLIKAIKIKQTDKQTRK